MKAIIHKLIFRGKKLHRVEVSHPWYKKTLIASPAHDYLTIDYDGIVSIHYEMPEKDTLREEWCSDDCLPVDSVGHIVERWRRSLCEIVPPELEYHHD